jgi:mannose-6-phosphate isomerase
MATSDNVIRAGLTPKLRDIPNLVSGLTYQPSEPEKHFVKPEEFCSKTKLFDPPVPEFSVLQVSLKGKGEEIHRAINGPSIAIVTEGSGSIKWDKGEQELHEGKVIFIGAGTEVTFMRGEGLELYRAFVE